MLAILKPLVMNFTKLCRKREEIKTELEGEQFDNIKALHEKNNERIHNYPFHSQRGGKVSVSYCNISMVF